MYTTELQPTKALSHRDCATILCALAFWQEHRSTGGTVPGHFDYFEDGTKELTSEELDALRESIQLVPAGMGIATAIVEAKTALVGGSNDAEHEALVSLVEAFGYDVPECECDDGPDPDGGHETKCPCSKWEVGK